MAVTACHTASYWQNEATLHHVSLTGLPRHSHRLLSWKIPCTTSYTVLHCSGLAGIRHQFEAVDDPASNLEYGVAPDTVMQLLFARENFADLAGYLSRAYKRRFSALDGFEVIKAAARDPADDVAALS
jgi:hypothetical protein